MSTEDQNKLAYHREYNKKWYANPENAAKKKADAKIHRRRMKERNRDFLRRYRENHPCEECGESHSACLDFHHNDPDLKIKEVTVMVVRCWSLEKIEAEISKCRVLCRNCHAKLHDAERKTGR